MPWYMYTFAGVFLSSFTDILRKTVLSGKDKLDYYTTAFVLSLTTFFVLLVYVLIAGFYMPPIASFAWVFVLNMGLGIAGLLTNQKGLSLLGVGEFTVLMTVSQVVAWIASILCMGVGLTARQGVGSAFIMLAIITVFASKQALRNRSPAGLLFTGLTALNYGVAVLTDQVVYRHSDPASFMVIGFGLTVLILAILRPRVTKAIRLLSPSRQGLRLVTLGGLSGMSLVLLFTSLKLVNNAPLFNGLSQVQIIVSVVAAMLILRERQHITRKLVGATFATVGAFLMVR